MRALLSGQQVPIVTIHATTAGGQTMINPRLEKFVGRALLTRRVGFGDLRRLQRDVLPQGFKNREEVEALLALDPHLERVDALWVSFLVAASRTFVEERTAGPADPEAALWLAGALAKARPRAARAIAREVTRDRPEIDWSLVAITKLRLSGTKASGEPSGAAEQGRGSRLAHWKWCRPEATSQLSWGASEAPP
jgi:hypothetical protein